MSRILLAFACFFGVLFRGRLPPAALQLLPDEFLPTPFPPNALDELREGAASGDGGTTSGRTTAASATAASAAATAAHSTTGLGNTGSSAAGGGAPAPAFNPRSSGAFPHVPGGASASALPRYATPTRGIDPAEHRSEGALLVLGLLQREGRLVDFLRESLDQHADAAIGAAVRDIHRGCKKVLDEQFRLEPVMPGREEGPVVVPRGFDPSEVRLIGKAAGDPPFRGILVHHGWRAVDVKLPTLSDGVDRRVLAPAEVRLG